MKILFNSICLIVLCQIKAGHAQEHMASVSEISNYAQLTEGIATSGQPTAEQFKLIADQGYSAVVNLMTPGSQYGLANEADIVASHGMTYINIPVVFQSPTLDDLKLFLRTLRALEDKKIWVHCALNARVSAFMYHYLKHERNLDEAAARSPMLEQLKPNMPPVWDEFLSHTKEEIGLW